MGDDIGSGCVCFVFCRGAALHFWVCQKRAEIDIKRPPALPLSDFQTFLRPCSILLLPDYLLWIPISRFIRWHRDMTTSRLPKLFWLRIEFSFLLWINCKKAYFNYEKKVVLACPITYDQIDEILSITISKS